MISKRQQSGFALILTLIVVSVALSIGLSMLDITVKQLTLGTTTRESEVAFQAAAAGMNCLQYGRNEYPSNSQINSGTFVLDCLNSAITMTDSDATSWKQVFMSDFDWDLGGGKKLWIELEMTVIDAIAGSHNYTDPRTGTVKSCAAGNICTYAIVRGHNRDKVTIQSGSIFSVERELTAEF